MLKKELVVSLIPDLQFFGLASQNYGQERFANDVVDDGHALPRERPDAPDDH